MKKEKRISPVKVKQEASMEVFNAWNDFMETYHKDPKGRYQSYDHCRKVFLKYYKAGQPLSEDQYREVALNLYTFLASWGMLRKGFLLWQKNCISPIGKVCSLKEQKFRVTMSMWRKSMISERIFGRFWKRISSTMI